MINVLIVMALCKVSFGAQGSAAEKTAFWNRAVWLLGFAEAVAATIKLEIEGPYQRTIESVSDMMRQHLGERPFDDQLAAGKAASLDEVSHVLDQSVAPPAYREQDGA